jgi:O-antigen/teichoic acid export membrane protein
MLGKFQSIKMVGWYETAVYLISLPLLLPNIMTLVFYTKISEQGVDQAWHIQKRLLAQIMLILITMAVVLYFLSSWLIPFLFGQAFSASVAVFQILLIAMLGMGFSQLMVAQWISRGLFLQAGAITITAGVTNVVLNYIFIPVYGMHAAAWTSVGAFMLAIVTNGIFAIWVELRVRKNLAQAVS